MTKADQNPLEGARARLFELSKDRGVSLSSLSDLLGRNPSYLQQFIRKGSPKKLEEGDRRKLAEFFGVSEIELGAKMVKNKEKSYTSFSGTGFEPPKTANSTANAAVDALAYADVPRLAIGASAGPGAELDSEAAFDAFKFSRRWLAEQGLERAQLSAITVEGDSMEPLLNNGDEILVDRSMRPFRDGIHVVRVGDRLMVKRVASAGPGKFALLSQNMAYPPVNVDAQEIEIIGRVVWKGGRI